MSERPTGHFDTRGRALEIADLCESVAEQAKLLLVVPGSVERVRRSLVELSDRLSEVIRGLHKPE